jgi:hypothetical protein
MLWDTFFHHRNRGDLKTKDKKTFLDCRTIKYYNRLPGKEVKSPSLESLKN